MFRQHSGFVYRGILRMGVSSAEAEELTQETFLVAFQKLEQYEERGSARAWLLRLGRNLALRHARGRRRERDRIEQAGEEPRERDLFPPDEELIRLEGVELVDEFLRRLPEEQREVFCLACVEGLTAPEISEVLDLNPNTVYSRIRLAKQKFNAFLSRRRDAITRSRAVEVSDGT
jgi:RNA polymerase sigma-70 factor (ECF subfamily)